MYIKVSFVVFADHDSFPTFTGLTGIMTSTEEINEGPNINVALHSLERITVLLPYVVV